MASLAKATDAELRSELERRKTAREQGRADRQAKNANRIRHALRNCRLWAFVDSDWRDMTDYPLMWFMNKSAGAKVARAKRGGRRMHKV